MVDSLGAGATERVGWCGRPLAARS